MTNFADETGTFSLEILYIVLQSVHLIRVFCQQFISESIHIMSLQ